MREVFNLRDCYKQEDGWRFVILSTKGEQVRVSINRLLVAMGRGHIINGVTVKRVSSISECSYVVTVECKPSIDTTNVVTSGIFRGHDVGIFLRYNDILTGERVIYEQSEAQKLAQRKAEKQQQLSTIEQQRRALKHKVEEITGGKEPLKPVKKESTMFADKIVDTRLFMTENQMTEQEVYDAAAKGWTSVQTARAYNPIYLKDGMVRGELNCSADFGVKKVEKTGAKAFVKRRPVVAKA